MATRFKLTAGNTTPAVSPAIQSYTHTNVARRQLLTSDSTALTNLTYVPDAADHLVAGDEHHVQYVSAPMLAGMVFTSGDTLKFALQCFEAHTNNNLNLQCFVSVVSWDGQTVQATIRSKVNEGTEMATSLTNRFLSTTLDGTYTTIAGDRLVVEWGSTGTPGPAASGVQGHNCQIRFGGNGAGGDLPENDTETGTTFNPWIEFATTITFGAETALAFKRKDGLYLPSRDFDPWSMDGWR